MCKHRHKANFIRLEIKEIICSLSPLNQLRNIDLVTSTLPDFAKELRKNVKQSFLHLLLGKKIELLHGEYETLTKKYRQIR